MTRNGALISATAVFIMVMYFLLVCTKCMSIQQVILGGILLMAGWVCLMKMDV